MVVKSKRLTFEQYLTYDDGTDKRYELEDGLLLEKPPATGKHELQSPPPLVVEVVSPESVERDYQRKAIEYQTIGISEYWIVDPFENKVSVL
ncbi:hypothetical protein NIES593_01375 [Hydrococcus rivularis NIES-593]|uniref:Putative restriction endonuclease domain-containing protein n=1 Tax=Hydrococcus rivularis NIES-593 TaxID=1921803 RepID=A0A1U7HT36_9CYAN|nr:Uma2 family endonuclease [Hydrococcus rivularis]OKH26729.1 hypothetical protein NIES593_01375 [Hydrococcus rivularis NIES-593]